MINYQLCAPVPATSVHRFLPTSRYIHTPPQTQLLYFLNFQEANILSFLPSLQGETTQPMILYSDNAFRATDGKTLRKQCPELGEGPSPYQDKLPTEFGEY